MAANQRDPKNRAPRYTETYSKRNYKPSKRPLVIILIIILSLAVLIGALAVSCNRDLAKPQGGNDTPQGQVDPQGNQGEKPNNGDKPGENTDKPGKNGNSDKPGTNGNSGSTGNNGSSSGGGTGKYDGSGSSSATVPNAYTGSGGSSSSSTPSQVASSEGSHFFTPEREQNSLKNYYKRLKNRLSRFDKFCESVFNEDLGSSKKTIKADYKKFLKEKKKILNGIIDSDGDWNIYRYYGDAYLDSKVDMAKASKLLKKRLDDMETAYNNMLALGSGASSSDYVAAANKALKNDAKNAKKISKLMKSAKKALDQ